MSENNNLFAKFAENWTQDSTFLTTPEGQDVSYGEAEGISAQVANYLADLSINPGDRISVQAEKSIDYLWLFLGCLRAGFAFHPLNPAYTSSELEYFFSDAEPALVIADPDNGSKASDVATRAKVRQTLTMDKSGSGSFRHGYLKASRSHQVVNSKADDIAALLYSSGTTGQPKGIPLTHENIAVNAAELSATWGFTRDDVLLHALPMFHTHGLFIALNCTFMSGSAVRYLSRFDAETVIDEFQNATVMMGVPTYYTRLLSSPRLDKARCRSIRLFTSGSAPLREDTFEEFETRSGHRIVERYGMSETVVLTSNPIDGARKPGTVGRPLPGVELRIADAADKPLADDGVGRIQVRGANVFKAYWRKPEKTAEDFTADGYFDTGDQGRLDADGYLSIVGRAKDLIISGGLNVYPIEVELALNEYAMIKESAVIGIPHDDFGEAVVAVIVLELDAIFDEIAVRDFCAQSLAKFKLPKRVVAVEELPRNAMGKVQKNILRNQYRELFSNN
jgi:malonyl-CoA/methylmalonyl-CoA synthetase